jgi:hypothetical protein
MRERKSGFVRLAAAVAIAAITLAYSNSVRSAGLSEEEVLATSIVPAADDLSTAPPGKATPLATPRPSAAVAPAPKPKATARHTAPAGSAAVDIEPANARLKLRQNTVAYAAPSKSSKHVQQLQEGKYVIVTGATRDFLQVKLKNGQTAYVDPAAVDLVKPTDKVFQLTQDAHVLDRPNRWGRKLADVHKPHFVRAIGVALNYLKIKMKNGIEGFIPMSALE